MTDPTPLTFTTKKASRSDPRPRSASTRARASSDKSTVDQAVGVMNNLYGAVGVGLLLAKLGKSAEVLADEKEKLEAANREAFAASPKLASLIAHGGEVSSLATFFIAHAMTGFAVFVTARGELAERRENDAENGTPNTAERRTDEPTDGYSVGEVLYGIPQTVETR